jgi:hypothetical protein
VFKPKYLVAVFIPLLIVLGLRSPDSGTDTDEYHKLYDLVAYSNGSYFNLRWEPGIIFLAKITTQLFDDSQVFIFLISFISLCFLYFGIKKLSIDPYLSILVLLGMGLYFSYFNGARQMLAVSMCLFSYTFILEKKKFPFLAMCVAASFIHFSSIIFFPMYWLLDSRVRSSILAILYLISLIFIVNPSITSSNLTKILPDTSHYKDYFEQLFERRFFLREFFYQLIFVFLLIYRQKILKKNNFSRYSNHLLNMQYCITITRNLVLSAGPAGRLSLFFEIFSILIIPFILFNLPQSYQKSSRFFVIFAGAILYLRSVLSDSNGILPGPSRDI